MEKSKIMELLIAADGQRTSYYSDETIQAIVEASRSDDNELRARAHLTVYNSLRAYEDDMLKTFGVNRRSQEYEDYLQELFIVIASDLSTWDPTLGALTTHFRPRFVKACISCKNTTNSTFSSPHYELVHADIKRAREALSQEGIRNPSPLEIRNQIALTKKYYSEQTIINCLEQVKDISSIDANRDISDSSMLDPVNQLIDQERKDEIIQCINSMEPQYRLIMQIEYMLYSGMAGDNKKTTNKQISEEYKKIAGPASDEWIKNLKESAERDFQHRYNRRFYKVNQTTKEESDIDDSFFVLQDDIKRAIEEDIEALFA